VGALLLGPQVDEALDLRGEELLRAVLANADDLLDAGDADAREADLQRRLLRLDVRGSAIFVVSLRTGWKPPPRSWAGEQ
jgi:hypothetical protein